MACDYGPSTCRVCQPGWGVTGGGRCVKCARTTGEPNCAACGLVSPTICEGCLDGGIAYFDTQGRRRCLVSQAGWACDLRVDCYTSAFCAMLVAGVLLVPELTAAYLGWHYNAMCNDYSSPSAECIFPFS